MDDAVRRWRQRGRLFFWFETDKRQGDGWHISADTAGCDDLEEIVKLAKASKYPARFSLAPVPITDSTRRSPEGLVVSHDRSWKADHCNLRQEAGMVTLEMGADPLQALLKAAGDIRTGKGDYTFGAEDGPNRIWVWWPPR
jgi:hypothetical protein